MIKYYIRKFSFPHVYGISNRSDEDNVATDTFTHANCATLYFLYAAPYIIQVSQGCTSLSILKTLHTP